MSDNALRRRCVTIPAVFLVFGLGCLLAPLLFPAAAVADVALRRRGWATTRLLAFVLGLLALEAFSLLRLGTIWLRAWCGLRIRSRRSRRRLQDLEYWYFEMLYALAGRFLDLRLDVDPESDAIEGGAIVVGRHASYGDAALPALLTGRGDDLALRYVLTRELLWIPCFDLVGNWLPNCFVDRTNADLFEVAALAEDLDERTVVTIFPEGAFRTPDRMRRRLARLEASSPELADRCRSLRHLLPPRPAGTLALLGAAPHADVIVLGHVGFEGFGSLHSVARSVPFRRPITVRMWRIPRAAIPASASDQVEWLHDQWQTLDDWITEHQ